MGEGLSSMFGGGSDGTTITNQRKTLANQQAKDQAAQQALLQKYMAIFGGPQSNQNFQQSLSGYYNNTPFPDIANKVAQQNAFHVKVPPVQFKVGGGGGGFDPTSMMFGGLF